MSNLEIRPSATHGRGVYATRSFAPGEVVECCSVLVVPAGQRVLLDQTLLYEYYFYWQDGAAALALGYGSLYNHSREPLARYRKDFDAGTIHIVAVRAVLPGVEITVDYTNGGTNPLWFAPAT
ncbi:SET domain-containing protein-lysine N-methyltransferase [Streptomyces griseus]|uniref:SET domain-containing protein-lysine N-methyltransferase n=1 Tax=Streptomyces griseus TaxID=1911 RepID=UPI0004C7F9F2|nr:SET domain-containing protein-lysine N-methyltransferase [Streptomyces griseus]